MSVFTGSVQTSQELRVWFILITLPYRQSGSVAEGGSAAAGDLAAELISVVAGGDIGLVEGVGFAIDLNVVPGGFAGLLVLPLVGESGAGGDDLEGGGGAESSRHGGGG